MTIQESIKIVSLLHNSYPQDKKATKEDLAQRAESYHISFADYDYETVKAAAVHCINTSKWHPTTKELLDAVARIRLTTPAPVKVTPIAQATIIDPDRVDEYLDAFCEWIGFGTEPNDKKELPTGVLNYEK